MQRFILALRQPPTLQEEQTVIDSPFKNHTEIPSGSTKHVVFASFLFVILLLLLMYVVERRMAEGSATLQWVLCTGLIWGMLLCLAYIAYHGIFIVEDMPWSDDACAFRLHNKRRLPPKSSLPIEHFYCDDARSFRSLVNHLSAFSTKHQELPLALLSADTSGWQFQVGWHCSPSVGLSLVSQLNIVGEFDQARYMSLQVADHQVPTLAVPFFTRRGPYLLLILQPQATTLNVVWQKVIGGPLARIEDFLMLLCSAIEAIQPALLSPSESEVHHASPPKDRTLIHVCAICHHVECDFDQWMPLAGLNIRLQQGKVFSHTYCPSCMKTYYHHG